MILKINSMYRIEGGYLVPRSHVTSSKGERYAIFQKLNIKPDGSYITSHITLTTKELRKIFKLERGEKIEIV